MHTPLKDEIPCIKTFEFTQEINTDLPNNLYEKQILQEETDSINYTTLSWIENIQHLIPSFSAEGTVYYNGGEVTSGITPLDFSKTVELTVTKKKYSKKYFITLICPQGTGLPIIKINTKNEALITSKETFISANFQVIDINKPEYCFKTAKYIDQIKGRGNMTWEKHPKKSYRIKFDQKHKMFGLTESKSWILLANWLDPTFIMNTVTFKLGDILNMEYNHNAVHVELFLNDSYIGSYVLTEHNHVGKGRIDIDEEKGFLCEIDKYYDEEPKFKTANYHLPVMIKSPKFEVDIHDASLDFVCNAINELDDAVFNIDSKETELFNKIIDTKSFVNTLLVNELLYNLELWHPKSVFLYKNINSKICMGLLWDFDWAFGYTGSERKYFKDSDVLSARCSFLDDIYNNKTFKKEYRKIWKNNFQKLQDILDFITEKSNSLEKSYYINKLRWDKTADWADYPDDYQLLISQMKTWLTQRFTFLNDVY